MPNKKLNKMKIIGFATQYYTLWNYNSEKVYAKEGYLAYIKHEYTYIKNISTDLDKVKTLYPDTTIDDTLRGKTSSFSYRETIKKEFDGNFNFGKYISKSVDSILFHDFSYCLWLVDNANNDVTDYIKNTEIYKNYIKTAEAEKNNILSSVNPPKKGDKITLTFLTNGYNINEDYFNDEYTCSTTAETIDGLKVFVKHQSFKEVDCRYPYIMPSINGKPRKTKNKEFEVEVKEVSEVFLNHENEPYIEIEIL